MKKFLTTALRIAQVHAAKIIHKNFNPSHLALNPTTGQLKLIDVGIAMRLSREHPAIRHPNILEGTLAYTSKTGYSCESLSWIRASAGMTEEP